MEAPGWDQLVSGEINAPSQLAAIAHTNAEIPLVNAQTAQTQAATGETDARSQLLNTENQQQQVALDLAQARSPLEHTAIQRAQLAQAMTGIQSDDPDASAKWDAEMTKLRDQGNPDAAQYIGKWTPAKQEQWTQANEGAGSPLALLDAMNGGTAAAGGAAGGAKAGAGGNAAYDPAQIQLAVSQMTPQQVQAVSAKVEAYRSALTAIENSRNPAQEFAKQAAALGHPEWADPSKFSQAALIPIYQQVNAWTPVLQATQFGAAIGAPRPTIPNDIKEAGGALYGVNPAGTTATPLTSGPGAMVGTDGSGRGVYYHPTTDTETVGRTTLSAKPGTVGAGAGGVFAEKQQAWLDVHPGDTQGALDYAGGKAGARLMTPVQIQMAANSAAARDVANQVITPDQENAAAARYASEYTALNGQSPGGAGGGGAPPDPDATARAQVASAWQQTAATVSRVAGQNPNHPWLQRGRGDLGQIEQSALSLPPMPGAAPPPANSPFAKALRPGKVAVAPNGQGWTVRNGQPVRLF